MVDVASTVIATQDAGTIMPDGTIYAGISPDTNKPMYLAAADAAAAMDFNQAAKYAKELEAHGCKDWRLPSAAEMSVIHKNLDKGALKGTFNMTSAYPKGQYWTSTGDAPVPTWLAPIVSLFSCNYGTVHRFADGLQLDPYRGMPASVRCVR